MSNSAIIHEILKTIEKQTGLVGQIHDNFMVFGVGSKDVKIMLRFDLDSVFVMNHKYPDDMGFRNSATYHLAHPEFFENIASDIRERHRILSTEEKCI